MVSEHHNETGFYYLQSRYYDSKVGRFINADNITFISNCDTKLNLNLFTYCNNNPVNMCDPYGNVTLLTCVVVGAVVSKLIYGKVNGWWVLGGALTGGVLGYCGGAFFGAAGIKAGTLASSIKMSKIRLLGRIGEQMSSWTKNSTRITSLTGSAKYRIPDYLNTAQYNYLLGYV